MTQVKGLQNAGVLQNVGFAFNCHNFFLEYPILTKIDSLKR